MNWRLKCLAFHALNHLPVGEEVHRWAQRRVTGRYFQTLTDDRLPAQRFHLANYERVGRPGGGALEFGAGSHLLMSVLLSAAGANVYAFDIDRLARVDRINHVIRNLQTLGIPGNWREIEALEDLEHVYGIHYCAPADARATGLPAGSIDFFHSSSVMEHIPEPDLAAILSESTRLSSPDALMSFLICYHDHYATTDRSISRLNFYRYGDQRWAFYNPSHHFQNRLRHSDFERLFAQANLKVLTNKRTLARREELDRVPIHPRFRQYSDEDLLTVRGHFLLKPVQAG